MTPEERASIKRAKVSIGLTPAQAEAVIAAQEAWDADPANPNASPSKPAKAQKPEKGGAASDGKAPAGKTD